MISKFIQNESSWFKGFLGFFGITYFGTGQLYYLLFFAFFSYFSNYISYRLTKGREDERLFENHKRAKVLSYKIPFFVLLMMLLIAVFFTTTKLYLMVICMVGISLNAIIYNLAFYYYERYT